MAETKLDLKKKRVRAFFLTLEGKKDEEEIQDKIIRDGLEYIQMRLPVEKITKEFEDALKKQIEHKIVLAKVREANEKDLENIKGLYNRAWLSSNTPFRPIDVDSLEKIFRSPDCVFLIAKVYGIDAGFVILDFEGKNNEIGIIAGLGVIPRFQRRGLGTILGVASWQYFKEKGVKELRCEVYKDNKVSHAFIKWIGFEEFGTKTYRKDDFLIDEDE